MNAYGSLTNGLLSLNLPTTPHPNGEPFDAFNSTRLLMEIGADKEHQSHVNDVCVFILWMLLSDLNCSAINMLLVYLCAFVGIPAAITAVLLAREVVERYQARSWPTHSATILESSVKTKASQSGVHHFVKIKYAYTIVREVLGQTVLPSRWGTSDVSEVQELMATFASGQTVPVHIHPQNPKQAIFITTIKTRDWAVAALFLVIGTLGCLGAVAIWKAEPNQTVETTAAPLLFSTGSPAFPASCPSVLLGPRITPINRWERMQ